MAGDEEQSEQKKTEGEEGPTSDVKQGGETTRTETTRVTHLQSAADESHTPQDKADSSREVEIAKAQLAKLKAQGGTKYGDPAIAGFAAFAVSTFLLTLNYVGFMETPGPAIWLGIPFGGLTQLMAGLLCFFVGNTFGFLAFSTYGSFWICVVFINVSEQLSLRDANGTNFSHGAAETPLAFDSPHQAEYHLGITFFLLIYLLFSFIMLVATVFISLAGFVTFFCLNVSLLIFVVDGFVYATVKGAAQHTEAARQAAGWFLLLTSVGAWYLMLHLLYQFTYKFNVLPAGPAPSTLFARFILKRKAK